MFAGYDRSRETAPVEKSIARPAAAYWLVRRNDIGKINENLVYWVNVDVFYRV